MSVGTCFGPVHEAAGDALERLRVDDEGDGPLPVLDHQIERILPDLAVPMHVGAQEQPSARGIEHAQQGGCAGLVFVLHPVDDLHDLEVGRGPLLQGVGGQERRGRCRIASARIGLQRGGGYGRAEDHVSSPMIDYGSDKRILRLCRVQPIDHDGITEVSTRDDRRHPPSCGDRPRLRFWAGTSPCLAIATAHSLRGAQPMRDQTRISPPRVCDHQLAENDTAGE